MLIIRRLNCIHAAFGIVLSVSASGAQVGRAEFSPCVLDALTEWTIPNAASMQFRLLMMSIQCWKHVEECNKYIVK
jgi:hypothetical protein